MKPINIKKNFIEIPIQGENGEILKTFYFEITDDSMKRIFDEYDEMVEKGQGVNSKDIGENEANLYIKQTFDSLLGDEAYPFFYELNPSSILLMHYLIEISSGIISEIQELYSDEKLNRYLYGK